MVWPGVSRTSSRCGESRAYSSRGSAARRRFSKVKSSPFDEDMSGLLPETGRRETVWTREVNAGQLFGGTLTGGRLILTLNSICVKGHCHFTSDLFPAARFFAVCLGSAGLRGAGRGAAQADRKSTRL